MVLPSALLPYQVGNIYYQIRFDLPLVNIFLPPPPLVGSYILQCSECVRLYCILRRQRIRYRLLSIPCAGYPSYSASEYLGPVLYPFRNHSDAPQRHTGKQQIDNIFITHSHICTF